jgi:hypothetical protein
MLLELTSILNFHQERRTDEPTATPIWRIKPTDADQIEIISIASRKWNRKRSVMEAEALTIDGLKITLPLGDEQGDRGRNKK